MAESLYDRAAKNVLYERPNEYRIKGTIATNEQFKSIELGQFGVNPDTAPEVIPASEALVRGVLDQLGELLPVLSIQQWIARESTARGGKGQLAAALLGIPYRRGGKGKPGMGKNRAYMNLLRALQRSSTSAKEAHKGLADTYRQLIADLPGGELGNPYTSADLRGRAALSASKAQLSINGDWHISNQQYMGTWKGTDLEKAARFDRVWNYPAAFVDEVVYGMLTPSNQDSQLAFLSLAQTMELDWLYGLSLIIELPRES